jgi:hypothetical protein
MEVGVPVGILDNVVDNILRGLFEGGENLRCFFEDWRVNDLLRGPY